MRLKKRVIVAKFDNKWSLLDCERVEVYELNEVGGFILRELYEKSEVKSIVKKLSDCFGEHNVVKIEEDLEEFVFFLKKIGIVVN